MKNSKTVIANVSNVETPQSENFEVATPKGKLVKLVKATDEIFGMNENTRPIFTVINEFDRVVSFDKFDIIEEHDNYTLLVEGKNETFQIDGYLTAIEYNYGTFGNLFNQYLNYSSCFLYGSKEIATSPLFVADTFGIPMIIAEKIFTESCEPVFAQLSTIEESELPKAVLSVIEKMKAEGYSESSIKKLFSFQKGRFDNVFRPTEKSTPTKIYLGSFNAEKNIEVKFIFEKESDKKSVPFKNFTELEVAFKAQMSDTDGHKKLSEYCKEVAAGYNATSTVQLVPNVIKIAELSEDMI
jgi:hypothetical protein